jgi:hypothetical protein
VVACTEAAARLADMAPRGSDDGGGIVKSPYSPGTYFVQKQEWVVRDRYNTAHVTCISADAAYQHFRMMCCTCFTCFGNAVASFLCTLLKAYGTLTYHAIVGQQSPCSCELLATLLNLMHLHVPS